MTSCIHEQAPGLLRAIAVVGPALAPVPPRIAGHRHAVPQCRYPAGLVLAGTVRAGHIFDLRFLFPESEMDPEPIHVDLPAEYGCKKQALRASLQKFWPSGVGEITRYMTR